MRKKIINISILISIVTILFAAIIGNTLEEVIYTILFILIIDAVQLVKNIFKLKNSSPEQIVQSITSVFNNTIVMNENVLSKLQGKAVKPPFKKYDFTAREKDIITNK